MQNFIVFNIHRNTWILIGMKYVQYWIKLSLSDGVSQSIKTAFRVRRSINSHPFTLLLSLLFSIVLMVDNHKALLESLITDQGPLNGSYETHWPFNAEDTARHAGRLTDSRANFLVSRFILRNTLVGEYLM